jgi:4-carboxymuconolactone decarboxylase
MSSTDRFEAGLEVRRSVLGEEYVRSALGDGPEPPSPLQQMITECGWGFIWTRDDLPRRTRSLLTIALCTALNRPNELRVHTRGARRNGCTQEEIVGAVLHCGPYCGIPASIDSMRVVQEVFDSERGGEDNADGG